jgi:hypothetical protein
MPGTRRQLPDHARALRMKRWHWRQPAIVKGCAKPLPPGDGDDYYTNYFFVK